MSVYLLWSWKPQKSQNSYFGNHSRTLFMSWSTRTFLPVLDVQLIFYLFSQIWMCVCVNLWSSPGKNTGVGCHSLLQGIILTQGSNPNLWHCRLPWATREAHRYEYSFVILKSACLFFQKSNWPFLQVFLPVCNNKNYSLSFMSVF